MLLSEIEFLLYLLMKHCTFVNSVCDLFFFDHATLKSSRCIKNN